MYKEVSTASINNNKSSHRVTKGPDNLLLSDEDFDIDHNKERLIGNNNTIQILKQMFL